MAYLNRHRMRRRATIGSPELVYLLIVLLAGVGTAWWAGHKIGMDLSGINAAAAVLGLTEFDRHAAVGYAPPASASTQTSAQPAPFCNPGESPTFALGMSELKQLVGDSMGSPVECEHPAANSGDTIQETTTGLAAYNHATNTATFTDGWRHWALTQRGLVTWEGTQADPPSANG
jgi:hypothetical protein